MSKLFLIEKILGLKKEETDEVNGQIHQDAIITSTYNMTQFAPIQYFPRQYRRRLEVAASYPIIVKVEDETHDDIIRNPIRTSIHFPIRPRPVLESRCQCSECYLRYLPIRPPDLITIDRDRTSPSRTSPLTDDVESNSSEINDQLSETSLDGRYTPSESSSEKYALSEATQQKTTNDKYVCNVCDRGFTWFGNFQKHVLTHGKPGKNNPFFPDGNISEERMIIREPNNTFRCRLCDKTFTRLSGLRTHIRMHSGQRPFKCKDCSLAFTTNRALKMHSRIHSGERPYKCSQCDKNFTRKDELQAHTYLHKGEKPYKCDVCSSAFVRQGHLQRHMLTHATEKPYNCKVCPKSFTQYRNLQTHMYKHTGERPYKCRYCGKGFTQHGTVQAHERTHTGTKPYGCTQCEKRFITSSHLRWHVKKHHNGGQVVSIEKTNEIITQDIKKDITVDEFSNEKIDQ